VTFAAATFVAGFIVGVIACGLIFFWIDRGVGPRF
jgi:hypothetical protein